MVNKKGWLRIVEAIVAILIVFGAVLTVATTSQKDLSKDFCANLPPLLEEISKNPSLRSEIINGQTAGVESFLQDRIRNPSLDYEVKICEPGSTICTHSQNGNDVEVCAEDRIISATIDEFDPKKLKVFLFRV